MQLLAAAGEPFYSKIRNRHNFQKWKCLWHATDYAWAQTQSMECTPLQQNPKRTYFNFFGMNSCPNTLKQLDATFGSRRGAVLQQNSESAHHPKIKVSAKRYQVGGGLEPIEGVHTLAGTWRMNKIAFFFGMNSSDNTIVQLDATFGSRRGAVLQQNTESAHRLWRKLPLTR